MKRIKKIVHQVGSIYKISVPVVEEDGTWT